MPAAHLHVTHVVAQQGAWPRLLKLLAMYHTWLVKGQLLVDAMSGSDDIKVC